VIRRLRRSAFPIAAAAVAFSLAAGFAPSDPDMYWHLASGRWMLDHHEILWSDVFSTTIAGRPYALGEWLGEVVLALAFAAGSWPGLVLLRSVLVAVAAFCAARLSRRGGASVAAAALVLAIGFVATRSRWTDRPALFTFVLFPLVLELLFAARAGSRRALLVIPPILLLWANLHGGYVVGLALVGAFAAEALLVRRRDARAFIVIFALAALATFADPETGRQLEVQTSDATLRRQYAAAAQVQRAAIATSLRHAGAAHLQLRTDRDWLTDVVKFVIARRRFVVGAVGAAVR